MRRISAKVNVVRHCAPLDDEGVRQRAGVEHRTPGPNIRKGIARVFVRVGREGRKALQFADRLQPDGQRPTVRRVPAIDRRSRLAADQQHGGERQKEQVVCRVERRDIALQPCDEPGGRLPIGHERRVQCGEPRRLEGLTLEADQQLSDQPEVVDRHVQAVKHRRDLPPPRRDDRRLHEQPDQCDGRRNESRERGSKQRGGDRCRSAQHPPRSDSQSGRIRGGPVGERARPPDVRLGGQHGQILAEVDAWGELGHRLLAGANLFGGRRAGDPLRQRRLSRLGARRVQKLKQ